VSKSKCVGKALILALFSVAFSSCNRGGGPSGQAGSQQAAAQELAWNKKAEKQLLDAIAQAPANGLKPDLFLKGDLPKDDAQRDAILTQAALRYADALAHGYVDPKKISAVYTIPRPADDVRPGLAQAIRNGNVGDWLASLPPQTDEYRALSQAHLQYLTLASQTPFQPIPAGKPIKPGRRDPRLPAVAAALHAVGYLANPSTEQRYTGPFVAAVKQLQSDWGLKPDGVIAGDTFEVLNLGPGGFARQLAIAMERLRWLHRNPPPTRIDVNTAAALSLWADVLAFLDRPAENSADQAERRRNVVIPAIDVGAELNTRPVPISSVVQHPYRDFGVELHPFLVATRQGILQLDVDRILARQHACEAERILDPDAAVAAVPLGKREQLLERGVVHVDLLRIFHVELDEAE
jgi:hypothetical protein